MKIKPEHYTVLVDALDTFFASGTKTAEEWGEYYHSISRTPMRFRWDSLYATQLKIGGGRYADGLPLYAYMNDDHIDTALRQYMKDAGLTWAATKQS